jgi:glycosyltransferase involved in cell wall biosynthesis
MPAQRILFLGKRFYTNKDALAERFGRVYRLPSQWAASGREVLLWLVDYHSGRTAREQSGTLRVISTPVPGLSVAGALVAALKLRPQVLVASGDCYIGLAGWILARLLGARFVFDVYDKYDEFGGYRKPFGFDLFGFLRRRADLKLFCSRALRESYAGEPGAGASVIVANGVDEAMFRPLPMQACREALDLPADDVLLGYFGSMEPDRGVGDLLRAMEILQAGSIPVRLLACGKADASLPLQSDAVIFRGMVPHTQMPSFLNAADVLVVPYRESPIMDMGASCKIAEYMMCQRPMVSTRTVNFTGNFPRQAEELGPGLCRPGDPEDMAASIRSQLVERRILSIPVDMGWTRIAAAALVAIDGGGGSNG